MCWDTVYLEAVEEWLVTLNDQQLKSVAKEVRLLELCGNKLTLPHSKSLGAGLFELRERSHGFRIYYTFEKNKRILLLYAGDKKMQAKDIIKSRRLLDSYRRRKP